MNWFISAEYSATYNITKTISFPMAFTQNYTIFASFQTAKTRAGDTAITGNFHDRNLGDCTLINWGFSNNHTHTRYWICAIGY